MLGKDEHTVTELHSEKAPDAFGASVCSPLTKRSGVFRDFLIESTLVKNP